MKISIAMGGFLPMPPSGFGAVERVWDGLAREYASSGHDVTVICKAGPGEPASATVRGVRYVRVRGFRRGKRMMLDLLKDLAYSLRVLRRLPDADILVSNTFWLPVLAPLLRPGAGRVVVHVARVPRGQYWLYHGAARFDTVSNYIKERVVASRPQLRQRVRVFPNPIDTAVLSPDATQAGTRGEPVILYLGRLHPEKGVHVLVDAFQVLSSGLPGAKLRIVGPWRAENGGGGEGYLRQLKQAAGGMRVEFLDPVSDLAQIAHLLRGAQVFCYPTLAEHGEASPLAPLEAMATGLVPVVSDLSQFRDYLDPGRNGIVFDHRGQHAAANLALQLGEALADPERLSAMSRAAVTRAAEFSYERVARMRLGDYEELVHGPA